MPNGFDEKLSYRTPSGKMQSGFVKELDEDGMLLLSMEPLASNVQLELMLSLLVGKSKLNATVIGTITKPEPRDGELRGYRVKFNQGMPKATQQILRSIVEGEKADAKAAAAAASEPKAAVEADPDPFGLEGARPAKLPQERIRQTKETSNATKAVKQPRKGLSPGLAWAFLMALIGVIGFGLYQFLGNFGLGAELNKHIEFKNFSVNYGTIIVTVDERWRDSHDDLAIKSRLKGMAEWLHTTGYNGVRIETPKGYVEGRILIDRKSGPAMDSIRLED